MNTGPQQHLWQSRIAAFIRGLPDSGRRKRWRIIARLAASTVPTTAQRAGTSADGFIAESPQSRADQRR